MTVFSELPEPVMTVVRGSPVAEFATVTARGVPIDTPLLGFTDAERGTIDFTTGLAYPVKAERARRNAKVGLLFEGDGGPDTPIVSVAALAAVRDRDIQANAERYIRQSAPMIPSISFGCSRDEVQRALWYWCRIWLECTPLRVRWWPSAAGSDDAPQLWEAAPEVVAPASDPQPSGRMSAAPHWFAADWRSRAEEVLSIAPVPHLTLVDEHGFPLPFRTRSVEQTDAGFRLDVPAGHPWRALRGPASLSFGIFAIFVGEVEPGEGGAKFRVDRLLPDHPLVRTPQEIFAPSPKTRDALLGRLEHELARRGQPMPSLSAPLFPEPTS
jgi:hypothetical protein